MADSRSDKSSETPHPQEERIKAQDTFKAAAVASVTPSHVELSGEHPPYFGMPASMLRRYLYRWSKDGMEVDYDGAWLCVSNLGYVPPHAAVREHLQTDRCGFDRNSSHSENTYV